MHKMVYIYEKENIGMYFFGREIMPEVHSGWALLGKRASIHERYTFACMGVIAFRYEFVIRNTETSLGPLQKNIKESTMEIKASTT